jgi:Fe-S-cluster containining protein
MTSEHYDELVVRVDALTAGIAVRRRDDLACARGCTACCRVQLSLSPLEAEGVRSALRELDGEARERVRERAWALGENPAPPADAACVMLEEDGGCAIYAARPLVCRTQGHALRYPAGSLPPEAVFATGAGGEITWCPLNYTHQAPRSEDVLEAERIDEILARINLMEAEDVHAALERASMVELAR